ncbi:hypothetical protein FFLO_04576 [Filobasidium floriforme]|uniref:BTB domain-containing protein n=1 Tax=Filobasidium floriforme TaxID=5210 RepID=A0A8K0JIN4_9TREE|nr:uncharacterized protein HD553DRAFT_344260 [Filobasidium floriforme]KAG7531082.1 hypothetical protein FFLO_04576 [Filobasidium floriforme]KAH8081546.1 hypothetical protein HD553DRAFT_344260 [Filobasidium floriforme]
MDDDRLFFLRCRLDKEVIVRRRLLLLSPVFRDMLIVGDAPSDIPDGRPSKRRRIEPTQDNTIPLDDDFGPLNFLFKLLDGSLGLLKDYNRHHIMGVKSLADKYELPLVTRLLGERLWQEVAEGTYYPIWAYAIAMRMQRRALARYALRCMPKNTRRPHKWSLSTAQIVGVDAWHCVINAANGCETFSWEKVSECLEFPPSWTVDTPGDA